MGSLHDSRIAMNGGATLRRALISQPQESVRARRSLAPPGSWRDWWYRSNSPTLVPSLDQPIPVVTLVRLVAQVRDQPLHVRHAHAEGRARLRDHVLLNHDAAQIIGAVLQRDLANVRTLRHPGTLDVRDVVQVNPAQRLGPQIFMRADRRRFQLRVLGLKRPGNGRGEATGPVLP